MNVIFGLDLENFLLPNVFLFCIKQLSKQNGANLSNVWVFGRFDVGCIKKYIPAYVAIGLSPNVPRTLLKMIRKIYN